MLVCLIVWVALVGAVGTPGTAQAVAQTRTPPQTAAQQQAPPADFANSTQGKFLVQYAERLLHQIDGSHTGKVWDQASQMARQAANRRGFIRATEKARDNLGDVVSRKFNSMTAYTVPKGKKVPAGKYATLFFTTKFSKASRPIHELVSFHFDSDGYWRFLGYEVR